MNLNMKKKKIASVFLLELPYSQGKDGISKIIFQVINAE